MTKFVGLRAKTYSYLINESSEDKKAKSTNKRKFKFENYKICLETTQIENKINYLKKIKMKIDSFKKNYKQFIRNNKTISKAQQRFKSEKHNIFTEEINKIASSSNDDKRIQSIDSIEINAYGTRKDLVSQREEIKYNNIIKRYKK